MKSMKHYFLFVVLFFLGCASTPLTVVDNVGRITPNPSYTIADTQQTIFVSFWVAAYLEVDDVDSVVWVPNFLEINKEYDIDVSKYRKIKLIMEVHNPKKIQYDTSWRMIYKKDKQFMSDGGPMFISKLPHRSYEIDLPLESGMKDCRYSIVIHGKVGQKMVLVHVGEIQYSTHGGE